MKKNNEGYVLVFVVVVMLVLALVATAVMTFSLHSLKSQQNSIQRTQDQYAAGGEIEKVVAKLENVTESESLSDICGQTVTYENLRVSQNNKELTVELTTAVENCSVAITCKLKITADSITAENEVYKITNVTSVVYESYQITTVTQEATTGGGET